MHQLPSLAAWTIGYESPNRFGRRYSHIHEQADVFADRLAGVLP